MQTHAAQTFDNLKQSGFGHDHLLSTETLSRDDITLILNLADAFLEIENSDMPFPPLLQGLSVFNLFFEDSTRTRISFELAAKKLGAHVVHFHAHASSLSKGESLQDTFQTLNAMGPDVVVIRHNVVGAPKEITRYLNCPVLNAGDGIGQHPTQGLLDALTIRQHFDRLDGLTLAICGDIKHSRVARSISYIMNRMGSRVRLIGPKEFLPKEDDFPWGEKFTDMRDGLDGADIVMMLRIQKERMPEDAFPFVEEYFNLYGLDRGKLSYAKPGAIVMHPGPMNRNVEISSDIADDPDCSVILQQVANGVAIRMACLDLLTRHTRRRRG